MSPTRLLTLCVYFFTCVFFYFPEYSHSLSSRLVGYAPPLYSLSLCMCPPITVPSRASPTMGAITVVGDTNYVAGVTDRGRMCGRQLSWKRSWEEKR